MTIGVGFGRGINHAVVCAENIVNLVVDEVAVAFLAKLRPWCTSDNCSRHRQFILMCLDRQNKSHSAAGRSSKNRDVLWTVLSNTIRMHRNLLKNKVPADLIVYEGLSHAQYYLVPKAPETKEHYEFIANFLDKVWTTKP